MKKLFLTIALTVLSFSAFAQTAENFNPGWFLGVQGGAGYTAGEAAFKDLLSPSAGLGAGYRFTPVFGLRGALSGWQAKGSIVNTKDIYKWNFAQLNVDAMIDLCNLFSKNKRGDRAVNPYLFAGIGVNDRFNNGAADLSFEHPAPDYIWTGNVVGFTGRFGLGFDFRISRVVSITLEWADNMYGDKFNSKKRDAEKSDLDWHQTAMIGLKFNLAREKKVVDNSAADAAAAAEAEAAARAAAEKAAAAKAAAEAEAARLAAEKAAAEKAAAEKAAAARAKARAITENVYYVIEKSNIRTSEEGKVQHVIDILKQYPEAVVTISGYADKQTGNATFNMKLSKDRAEGVAKALVDAGIAPERITVNYFGDTQTVSDVPAENRVSVCVTR